MKRNLKQDFFYFLFLQYFVIPKPFKLLFTDFLLKKQKLKNSVYESQTLFFQKGKYSFTKRRICYGVTVTIEKYEMWLG